MAALTKDLVKNPSLWRLSLEVCDDALEAAINTPLEDHALIYRRLPFDKSMEPLAAFEEVIYDNPLLLADFKQCDVLVNTKRFTIVPDTLCDPDAQSEVVRALWPDADVDVVACPMPQGNTLLMGVDSRLVSFIRRTFLDAELCHPLSVLAAYFSPGSHRGNSAKLYAHLRGGGVDLVGLSRNKLLVANTIDATSAADIAYYILAAAQTSGLDLEKDEVMLCGDTRLREEVSQRLDGFARYVMPVIFPSELFKAGRDVLRAPFELIILPLCE